MDAKSIFRTGFRQSLILVCDRLEKKIEFLLGDKQWVIYIPFPKWLDDKRLRLHNRGNRSKWCAENIYRSSNWVTPATDLRC